MIETLSETPCGVIRLEKRLLRFVINRENLDPHNPILDLSKPTIIRQQLTNQLARYDDLGSQESHGIAYCERLKFRPRLQDSKMQRVYLDANSTFFFNRFLHRLFEELLFENIANFKQFNPKKSTLDAVEFFLNKHRLTIEDYPDVNFEHDSLVKADYRLRVSRNLVGFNIFPPDPSVS